jgi:transmembrane sensor
MRQFLEWLDEPAHRAAYDAVETAADLAGDFAADPAIRRLRAEALTAAPAPGRFRARSVAFAALGGAVAASLVAGLAFYWPKESPSRIAGTMPPVATIADAQAAAATPYVTGTGETRVVTLNDGSVVTLNTTSVLEVTFSPTERDVRLVEGQAMFQVSGESERPFVVAAGDRRITAQDTALDVRVEPDRVAVVIVQGHAVVDALRPAGIARVIPALGRYGLGPGEQLVAAPGNSVSVTAADTERTTSWRHGQLIFRDDTIADALAEMNRYSTVKFVVEDAEIAHLRISGVFKTTRPENLIAALVSSYPVEAEKRSPLVTALVRRERS